MAMFIVVLDFIGPSTFHILQNTLLLVIIYPLYCVYAGPSRTDINMSLLNKDPLRVVYILLLVL